jgi:hypothetical protein
MSGAPSSLGASMDKKTYLAVIDPAMKLVVSKHEDYNSGIALDDYFPFLDASYIHMLNTKVLRLRSLYGRAANHEGQLDTVYDLINYAVFYAKYLQEKDKL